MLKTFETFQNEQIRVSCAGLAQIMIGDKYLLIVNKNSVKMGSPRYGPLGGALEFTPDAKPFLDSLNVEYEKGMDLRLHMSKAVLPKFESWFTKKIDREHSAIREVYEELCLEEQIVCFTIDQLTEKYLRTSVEDKLSDREGNVGTPTRAMYEIYSITLSAEISDAIVNYISNTKNPKVLLLTKEEILKGDSSIGNHSKHIV